MTREELKRLCEKQVEGQTENKSMDIIAFVEDVLGVHPNDWQKDYLKRMYGIYKDDRDNFIVMCRRGQPTCMSVALGLYETFKHYEFILDPYQRYELMHPRKKPRGSIRRNRRK